MFERPLFVVVLVMEKNCPTTNRKKATRVAKPIVTAATTTKLTN